MNKEAFKRLARQCRLIDRRSPLRGQIIFEANADLELPPTKKQILPDVFEAIEEGYREQPIDTLPRRLMSAAGLKMALVLVATRKFPNVPATRLSGPVSRQELRSALQRGSGGRMKRPRAGQRTPGVYVRIS